MSDPALRPGWDNLWQRLPLELALAAALGVLMLLGFLSVLGRIGQHALESRPIEAQLVVIPPAPRPEAIPKPVPEPNKLAERPAPRPVLHRPTIHRLRRAAPEPQATTPAEVPIEHAPVPPAPQAEAAPAVPATAAGAPRLGSLGLDQMSARAILSPMPQITEQLREHALDTVAVVRFSVAADGSAKATLVQATAIPQLNELLLEAFNRWRFFPALRDGKPVASIIELRVPVKIE